jgi:hypothetical protein
MGSQGQGQIGAGLVDSSIRGSGQAGGTSAQQTKRYSAFGRNKGKITPTPGFMASDQVARFLDYLIKNSSDFSDLASADHQQLVDELLVVIVMRGGEERSYTKGGTAVLNVGGKDRVLPLDLIPQAANHAGSVIRGFSKAYTAKVKAILVSDQSQEYFRESYGLEADPLIIRSDLFHRRYSHKYDAFAIGKDRDVRLSRAASSVRGAIDDDAD